MRKLYVLFLFLMLHQATRAQSWGGGVDDEDYHFGFVFQYISSEFKIIKNNNWREGFNGFTGNPGNLTAIYAKPSSGFGAGIVFNKRVSSHLDFRITPSLVFNDQIVNYEYDNSGSTAITTKKIESIIAEFPFGLKLKSDRRKDFSVYVLAGGKYSVDIGSEKKRSNDGLSDFSKNLIPARNYLSYEAGIGFDLYYENFKLSPEVKLSYSVKDLLQHDNTPYATPIDKMMLRHFTFSLFIE